MLSAQSASAEGPELNMRKATAIDPVDQLQRNAEIVKFRITI